MKKFQLLSCVLILAMTVSSASAVGVKGDQLATGAAAANVGNLGSGHIFGNGTGGSTLGSDTPLITIMRQSGSGLGSGVAAASANTTNGPSGVVVLDSSGNFAASIPFTPRVDTNAALKLYTGTGTVVRSGFYTAGDAAGPTFYTWVSAACSLNGGSGDDGSQVQAPNSHCFLASPPPAGLTIYQFGAHGDGSTADDTPIANWYAAAVAYGRGFCSSGTYKLTAATTWAWPLNQGPTLQGASQFRCIFDGSATSSAFLKINAANGTGAFFGKISDMGFRFNHAGPGVQIGEESFADAFNSFTMDTIYVSNSNATSGSSALEINYSVQGRFLGLNLVGSNNLFNGDALKCRQCVNNQFSGAYSTASVAVHFTAGTNNANAFYSPDFENFGIAVQTDNNSTVSNTLYTPVLGALITTSAHPGAISAVVAAGGSGGTNGSCTVTTTGGTASAQAQFSGTVTANALAGALTLVSSGDYLSGVYPTNPVTVTGCGLTGATLTVTWAAALNSAGVNGGNKIDNPSLGNFQALQAFANSNTSWSWKSARYSVTTPSSLTCGTIYTNSQDRDVIVTITGGNVTLVEIANGVTPVQSIPNTLSSTGVQTVLLPANDNIKVTCTGVPSQSWTTIN